MNTYEQIGEYYIKTGKNDNGLFRNSKWYSEKEIKTIINKLNIELNKSSNHYDVGYVDALTDFRKKLFGEK